MIVTKSALSLADLWTVAQTVFGEARGEPYAGKIAVAHVIRNRLAADWRGAATAAAVCLDPYQFSCWLAPARGGSVINLKTMQTASIATPGMADSLKAVADVFGGQVEDPTGGADHYKTKRARPRWARGKTPVAVIGGHQFYKLTP